jgi:anti-sigma factor RsiW
MTCKELIDFLGDYLEGDLPPAERREFECHLVDCAACVEYVRSYEETIRLGRGALKPGDEGTSDDVPPELIAAILAARRVGV